MGHGASAGVRKVSLVTGGDDRIDSRPVWNRSNSDGCIVETLNSSKTKVDLLELQLCECKALLKASELKQKESENKANTLEKQLAEVEGTNFELTDRVSDLEQQLESVQGSSGEEVTSQLEQELAQSNQEVEKLEMHVKVLEEQMVTMRSKFRKKLRAANTEVTEVKQESSLKLYSLKDQLKQFEEENIKLSERLERASSSSGGAQSVQGPPFGEDSRTMVILELSNQVSMQEGQIADLQDQLEQKERSIADLTQQLTLQRPPSRPPSGLTSRPVSGQSSQQSSLTHKKASPNQRKGSGGKTRSVCDEPPNADFPDSDGGEGSMHRSDGRLGIDSKCPDLKTKNTSARSRRRDRSGEEKDGLNHESGKTSSRERRGSADQGTQQKDTMEEDADRPKSSSCERGSEEGSQKRKRSSSRSKKKESLPMEVSERTSELSTQSSSGVHISSDFDMSVSDRTMGRTSSAGSRDSAFHETAEEGTKSAPSSAGSSKTRRRLKTVQQRAASLEVVTDSGKNSPKPPSRTSTNLYDRDSGVDENCLKGATKSGKASDQELDDLLQEILCDQNPSMREGVNHKAKQGLKSGISEEKIRSLLSDGAT